LKHVIENIRQVFAIIFSAIIISLVSGENAMAQSPQQVFNFEITKNENFNTLLERLEAVSNVKFSYDAALSLENCPIDKSLWAADTEIIVKKTLTLLGLESLNKKDRQVLIRKADPLSSKCVLLSFKDENDNTDVSYLSIYNTSDSRSYMTDEYGDVILEIDTKNDCKVLHLLAYSIERGQQRLQINLNEETYFIIKISKAPFLLPIIQYNISLPALNIVQESTIKLRQEQFNGFGTMVFGNDLQRTGQYLPGIIAVNDISSGISIRGASEDGTLMILDEMPIYRVDHFFGILSAMNADYIQESRLHRNIIPVSYGGRTSGMLEMSSLHIHNKDQLNLHSNLLFGSIAGTKIIGQNGLLKIAGRHSYKQIAGSSFYNASNRSLLDILNNQFGNTNQVITRPAFKFHDLNAGYSHSFKNHTLAVNIFNSSDIFEDKYSLELLNPRPGIPNREIYEQSNQSNNFAMNFVHQYHAPDYSIKNILYYSKFQSNEDLNTLFRLSQNNEIEIQRATIENKNHISDWGYKLQYSSNKKRQRKLGLEIVHHHNVLDLRNDDNILFLQNTSNTEFNAFYSEKIELSDKLQLRPGLRTLSYQNADNRNHFLLPQINMSWIQNENILFKAAAGRHVQLVRLLLHEAPNGQAQHYFAISNGNSIPEGRSINLMLGGSLKKANTSLDLELFHRKLEGALNHATRNPGLLAGAESLSFGDYNLFSGTAKSTGVDFSFLFDDGKNFSLLNYMLSSNKIQMDAVFSGEEFSNLNDRPHQFKWAYQRKAQKMDFSLALILATGQPFFNLSNIPPRADRSSIKPLDVIDRLPHYQRIDFAWNYHFSYKQQKLSMGFAIFNISNHQNIMYRQFLHQLPGPGESNNNSTNLGADVIQFGRLFNVNLRVQLADN
jgi:ferric enterobactin receptor